MLFKRIGLAVALSTALAFGGCVSPGPTTSAPVISSTTDEKALLAAEDSFTAILKAVNLAADSGKLKGANAIKVRDALKLAKQGLDTARAAYAAGNVVQMTASISSANGLVGLIRGLIN